MWVRVFHSIQSHKPKGQTKTIHNQQLISYMLSWQEFSQAHSKLNTQNWNTTRIGSQVTCTISEHGGQHISPLRWDHQVKRPPHIVAHTAYCSIIPQVIPTKLPKQVFPICWVGSCYCERHTKLGQQLDKELTEFLRVSPYQNQKTQLAPSFTIGVELLYRLGKGRPWTIEAC